MQVTAEKTKPGEVELKIEIDADQVNQTVEEVYQEYSRITEVPGFRKGKAPRYLVERYVSPESVKRRAIEKMIPKAYAEALKQKDIQPFGEPDFEIVQFEKEQPFIFKASVPLPPVVELGEYKGIEVERKTTKITDEDVEAYLEQLQQSRATAEKVENRGIAKGDLVVANIASAEEGKELGEPRRCLIEVGSNLPDFDENILGMEVGQRRVFTAQYPESYPDKDLAGKTAQFDVTIESIREPKVPELNDDFAKSVSEFQTLDELKEDIRKKLFEATEAEREREVEDKIIEEIISRSKIEFPEVMVEHEVYHDLEDLQEYLGKRGMTFEIYLKQLGMSKDQFLEDCREAARNRIKKGLVLGEIAEKENITVSEEEVNAEIDRLISKSGAPKEAVEAYVDARGGRSRLANSLLTRKIMDFLKSVSVIKHIESDEDNT